MKVFWTLLLVEASVFIVKLSLLQIILHQIQTKETL